MAKFCHMFFEGVQDDTFVQSCGMADLITACYGGRNRKCAEAFARETEEESGASLNPQDEDTLIDPEELCESRWQKIESDLLNGQKLQRTLTAKEVHALLESRGMLSYFPLINTIYEKKKKKNQDLFVRLAAAAT